MAAGQKTMRRRRLRVRTKRVNRSLGGNLLLVLILALLGVFMALPLVYAVVNAFKPLEEFFMFPPKFIVMHPTLNNFLDLFEITANSWVPFSRYVFNSVFVSVAATGLYLVIAAMCAYVLAKHEFFGKKTLSQIITLSLLFTSPTVMAIPQYIILAKLGMIDTSLAIIFPALGSTMGVFLLKQTMETFPDSIIESAKIEGAGEMSICWRIVMPAVKPGWITLLIFTFQGVWNNTAVNMIFTENKKVLPTMLTQLSTGTSQVTTGLTSVYTGGIARAGVGAVASLFILIPPIVVFLISQSQVIETMAHSGIKE